MITVVNRRILLDCKIIPYSPYELNMPLFAFKCAFEMEYIMLGQTKKTETLVHKTDYVCDPIVVWGKVSY